MFTYLNIALPNTSLVLIYSKVETCVTHATYRASVVLPVATLELAHKWTLVPRSVLHLIFLWRRGKCYSILTVRSLASCAHKFIYNRNRSEILTNYYGFVFLDVPPSIMPLKCIFVVKTICKTDLTPKLSRLNGLTFIYFIDFLASVSSRTTCSK